ncbi:signal peptide peptidase-domain-containing protein [Pelagophyceae sp. CCMP2097]|nr:signal peptide peptidase-domain-containing protein [Pelagophyceae sp. CCMP2097]
MEAACVVAPPAVVGGHAVVVACAVLVVDAGVRRSLADTARLAKDADAAAPAGHLGAAAALAMPFWSSALLLVVYFCWVDWVAVAAFAAVALATTFSALEPFARHWLARPALATRLAAVASVGLVAAWVRTGHRRRHWLAVDAIGACSCVALISAVDVPDLRVACVFLCGLGAYDVFWVFFSEELFGGNVMVEVAQRSAANPAQGLAGAAFGSDFARNFADELPLPIKLLFPAGCGGFHVLGLGDIAIPGLLVSLAARFGVFVGDRGYRSLALAAYAFGLSLASGAAELSAAPQPALLYIVPCVLLPLAVYARRRPHRRGTHLEMLWYGFEDEYDGGGEEHGP